MRAKPHKKESLNVGKMKYYELYEKYKRSAYFFYSEENKIDRFDFFKGKQVVSDDPIIYEVDKIDTYLEKYDYLPVADGPPLVSKRFREVLEHLEKEGQIAYLRAKIIAENGEINDNYFAMVLLKIFKGIDFEKSVVKKDSFGTIQIQKLFLTENFMLNSSICRLEEKESVIIVNEEFKKLSLKHKLKGMDFVEEGYSIYTNL